MNGMPHHCAIIANPFRGSLEIRGAILLQPTLHRERTRSLKAPAMNFFARVWAFILESLEALRDDDQDAIRKERELALRQKRWLDYLSRP